MVEESQDVKRSLFFTCGHVISRNTVVIPAQYNALSEVDISRVALKFGDVWAYHDVDNDAIGSVTFRHSDQSLWLLGRHGIVRTVGGAGNPFTLDNIRGKFTEETIDIGRHGELLCVNIIGDAVYACGQSAQVYVRGSSGWKRFDHGMRKMAVPGFESIDGSGPDDIYVAGEKGVVAHFDGNKWTYLDSPTNRPLSSVCCISKDEVYLCGNNGLIFKGSRNGWQSVGTHDMTYKFWDMELFEDKLYLAHAKGIVVYDGKNLQEMDFGMEGHIACHKLHAADGVLWSFGIDDLLVFDGNRWDRVICPENQ
jgi:hypothetical protein